MNCRLNQGDFMMMLMMQDMCKMCRRCVQDVCKMCARCVQDVCKMCARCAQDVCQSVTVPRIFSGTGTGTFFRDQIFPVPVPVLFSGTNFFRYRDRYFFPGPIFSGTGTGIFFPGP